MKSVMVFADMRIREVGSQKTCKIIKWITNKASLIFVPTLNNRKMASIREEHL